MKTGTKIYKLDGRVQHYAWGGHSFLPNLLQVPNVGNKPFAEYWMGAHNSAPSMIANGEEKISLPEWVAQNAKEVLGAATAARFGRLPYLFKILDVSDMLSIQVHPSKKDAVIAFEEENARGVAADDPKRNYKDDNHKPELAYALSEFWLLHGFKSPEKLQKILAAIPELSFLHSIFEHQGYEGLYKHVMEMPQDEVNLHLQPLLDKIVPLYEKDALQKNDENFWAARAAKTFNSPGIIDRGIFSVYIFNLVQLAPGDAIFQDAGIPHAYLEGQNVEIMANSDNVLRGGLTPKHIDVAELLKHVKCEPIVPAIIHGIDSANPREQVFLTPAADFELRMISLDPGVGTIIPTGTTDIFFVYRGEATIDGGKLSVGPGESFVAGAGERVEISAVTETIVFRATVPQV